MRASFCVILSETMPKSDPTVKIQYSKYRKTITGCLEKIDVFGIPKE
jgi:hypothetical protein